MKPRMHQFRNADIQSDHVCFVYLENKIWMIDKRLPTAGELSLSLPEGEPVFRLKNGWALSAAKFNRSLPQKVELQPLRDAFDCLAAPLTHDTLLGAQLVNWSDNTLHCCRCGASVYPDDRELLKLCSKCRTPFYPQLTPVVIVLIKRGRELLLARGPAPRKHFSCLAGYVEPGETLEEAIRREVKEEVGVEIRNIRYFGSQPWPFPHNIMLAFTAEWVTGEIQIDKNELTDARWFSKETLPENLPPKISISRQMIESALRGM